MNITDVILPAPRWEVQHSIIRCAAWRDVLPFGRSLNTYQCGQDAPRWRVQACCP